MKLINVSISNFKSIKKSGLIEFSENLFVLAGQNESGKSSILEALEAYEKGEFKKDSLNFEEEQNKNLKQTVSCTYKTDDSFYQKLFDKIKEDFTIEEDVDFLDKKIIEKIDKYTIEKTFDHEDGTLTTEVSENVCGIILSSIKTEKKLKTDENGNKIETDIPLVILNKEKISEICFLISPQIVLFNDFSDLLPDKILISDLDNEKAEGYKAVKNIESLMSRSFKDIASSSTVALKNSTTAKEVESLSVTFQKDWKQKIHGNNNVEITFGIENEDVGGQAVPTIFFYVQTKDNVPLEPRKRSKGMIWFLSTWLDLKSRENSRGLIILYDEPGLYLHIKAHQDILGVFDTLVQKGHQIVYSTHSPSLIDTKKLSNIGLVLNTEKDGTIVEGLTTSKINNEYKRDALQPIANAMGLEPLKEFTILSEKNVLLEGLSDYWYFSAMKELLEESNEYKFVPGIGIKGKIDPLISFCLGYGLDWVLVMDNGQNPQKTRNDLKSSIFNKEEEATNKKVKLISSNEIENMFTISDLQLLDDKIKSNDKREPAKIIGKSRKIVFARRFYQKVSEQKITKKSLSKESIKNFQEVFKWINSHLTSS